MFRLLVALLVLLLLALTVPWWFVGAEAGEGDRLPGWVVYALVMNAVFPVAVAVLLARCWQRFEREEEQQP